VRAVEVCKHLLSHEFGILRLLFILLIILHSGLLLPRWPLLGQLGLLPRSLGLCVSGASVQLRLVVVVLIPVIVLSLCVVAAPLVLLLSTLLHREGEAASALWQTSQRQ
jgi:hypothetical protein